MSEKEDQMQSDARQEQINARQEQFIARQEQFNERQEQFNARQEQFNDEQKRFNEQQMKFNIEFKKNQEKNSKRINKLEETSNDIQHILLWHNEKIKEYDDNFAFIKRSLMIIEEAVTTKFPILFDSHTANYEKHSEYDKDLSNLKDIADDHSVRISHLENVISKI